MTRMSLLAQVSFFASLDETELRNLADRCRLHPLLTQQDLARIVGMTRVSVHRHLNRLEQEGILTADREGITLHQPEVLWRQITRSA
jgi:DNA-binding transcriptional ArsR family regulator